MNRQDQLVRTTAATVRIAWTANRLFFLAVAVGLPATWVFPEFFRAELIDASPAVDVSAAMHGVRLLILIGIAMAIATDRLLVALAAIVATAQLGEPCVIANARRLVAIGWALLAVQLLDIPCAWLARLWPSLGSAAPAGDVSVGGWIATLMVFVLSRIFAAGAAMRDDLAGTV